MEDVIQAICDAADEYDMPNPEEWKSFSENLNSLKKAIEEAAVDADGEGETFEVEHGGWMAEVRVEPHITHDPGDGRWVAPTWDVDRFDYTVLDLWRTDANVSADLKLRKRLDDILNRK